MQATVSADQGAPAGELVRKACASLAAAGVRNPRLDAEVLLATACSIDRSSLYLRRSDGIRPDCAERFASLLARRIRREPLQYIVGRQEFWSLDFIVTPEVLIPRAETELLVELTLNILAGNREDIASICDLGTGSGGIAIALAHEVPDTDIWALDVSRPALTVAQTNARTIGVAERIRFVESNLLAAVGAQRFDVIVTNPPYVRSSDLSSLEPELSWEPRTALDGGRNGLAVIQPVLATAPRHLREGGWLVMEIGAEQKDAVEALARDVGFNSISIRADYAGLPRVLLAQR